VLQQACKKLIVDMHYQARPQAVVTYHKSILGEDIKKLEARQMMLTKEQFIAVHKEYEY
jgi:hypothetical protein